MSTLLATNNNDCHQSGEYAANHIDDGQQMLQDNHRKDSLEVASRKLAAAELRRARKAARENPRIRLFSDSSDEVSFARLTSIFIEIYLSTDNNYLKSIPVAQGNPEECSHSANQKISLGMC